jgi:hypothetical protein
LIELAGVGALLVVSLEWLGLGWLSGMRFPDRAGVATWALRLLVGACLVAAAQLVLALLGVGFGSIPLVLLLAGAAATVLRVLRAAQDASRESKVLPAGAAERIGWVLLAAVLLAAGARSVLVPESGWDAFSHWGLRAQAFALAHTVVNAHSEHEYYPPLVPLLEAWLYLHLGTVSIDLGKTIWAVIGSAFAICLGWHLRLSLPSPWLAPYLATGVVLGTGGLLTSFWTGQADLALAAFLTLSALAVWQWQRAPTRGWLVQAAIFAAAAVLTKFEGLPRVGIVVLALVAQGATLRTSAFWRPAAILTGSAAAAWLVWTAFELTIGIAPNGEHVGPPQVLAIGSVLAALAAVLGGVRTGGGLLVATLAWGVTCRSELTGELRLLVLIVVGQLGATLVAFLVSVTPPEVEVLTSATRLLEQILPLALFVSAVGLARTSHL